MAAVTIATGKGFGFASGRKVVATSAGQLWACVIDETADTVDFYYSNDNGASWAEDTGGAISLSTGASGQASIFIDEDDNIYALTSNSNTNLILRIGTISGNAITWNGTTATILGSVGVTQSDLVVVVDGSTYLAFPAWINSSSNMGVSYFSWNGSTWNNYQAASTVTGTFTSVAVDFHHTGNEKTTKSATPHVFFAGIDTGPNPDALKFVKSTWSSGPTYTPGTTRTISTSVTGAGAANVSLIFDGTRVVMSAVDTNGDAKVYERDVADTTTTDRTPSTDPSGGKASADLHDLGFDSSSGNLYFFFENTSAYPSYAKYDRAGDTWDSAYTVIESETSHAKKWAHTEGGTINNELVPAWQTPGGNTRAEAGALSFNSAPSASITAPVDGTTHASDESLVIDWDYSDPDSDPQSAFTVKRVIDALTTEYWNGSGWQASEDASTKISSATSLLDIGKNWADPSSETSHVYSVKVWDDQGLAGSFSSGVTVYPISNISTSRGFSLPRPIKRQSDILATLKSNNDYMLSWVNNYVPAYGDLNDDLYLKAGLRPGGESTMRSMYPPTVGSFSVGDGSNYFQNLGATNVYRSNELSLSSRRAKNFMEKRLGSALSFVLEAPVRQFSYKREELNGDSLYRLGLVAEDVVEAAKLRFMSPRKYAFTMEGKDADGEETLFLNSEQLIYVLWQAVQELYALVEDSIPPNRRVAPIRRPDV